MRREAAAVEGRESNAAGVEAPARSGAQMIRPAMCARQGAGFHRWFRLRIRQVLAPALEPLGVSDWELYEAMLAWFEDRWPYYVTYIASEFYRGPGTNWGAWRAAPARLHRDLTTCRSQCAAELTRARKARHRRAQGGR
jgi:hypothetical protein